MNIITLPKYNNKIKGKRCTVCGEDAFAHLQGVPYCRRHYLQMKRGGIKERTTRDPNELIDLGASIKIVLYNKSGQKLEEFGLIDDEDITLVQGKKVGFGKFGEKKYCYVSEKGKITLLHRYVWEKHNGKIPSDRVVDHINGNGLDCRKENLRLASSLENSYNLSKPNKFTGVNPTGNRFNARIMHDRKDYNLGTFPTLKEALDARIEAERRYFGSFGPNVSRYDRGLINYSQNHNFNQTEPTSNMTHAYNPMIIHMMSQREYLPYLNNQLSELSAGRDFSLKNLWGMASGLERSYGMFNSRLKEGNYLDNMVNSTALKLEHNLGRPLSHEEFNRLQQEYFKFTKDPDAWNKAWKSTYAGVIDASMPFVAPGIALKATSWGGKLMTNSLSKITPNIIKNIFKTPNILKTSGKNIDSLSKKLLKAGSSLDAVPGPAWTSIPSNILLSTYLEDIDDEYLEHLIKTMPTPEHVLYSAIAYKDKRDGVKRSDSEYYEIFKDLQNISPSLFKSNNSDYLTYIKNKIGIDPNEKNLDSGYFSKNLDNFYNLSSSSKFGYFNPNESDSERFLKEFPQAKEYASKMKVPLDYYINTVSKSDRNYIEQFWNPLENIKKEYEKLSENDKKMFSSYFSYRDSEGHWGGVSRRSSFRPESFLSSQFKNGNPRFDLKTQKYYIDDNGKPIELDLTSLNPAQLSALRGSSIVDDINEIHTKKGTPSFWESAWNTTKNLFTGKDTIFTGRGKDGRRFNYIPTTVGPGGAGVVSDWQLQNAHEDINSKQKDKYEKSVEDSKRRSIAHRVIDSEIERRMGSGQAKLYTPQNIVSQNNQAVISDKTKKVLNETMGEMFERDKDGYVVGITGNNKTTQNPEVIKRIMVSNDAVSQNLNGNKESNETQEKKQAEQHSNSGISASGALSLGALAVGGLALWNSNRKKKKKREEEDIDEYEE